jgi:molecular chaperone GrpE (heat shock protein)
MKTIKKTLQADESAALRRELAEIGKSILAFYNTAEELAEDYIALRQTVKKIADAQESVRLVMLQEICELRSQVSGELTAHFLRNCCRELAPVLNALQSMLAESDFSDPQTIRQHVESLAITLGAAFGRMGLERIPITVGTDLFDSQMHDCVRICTPLDSPFPEAPSRTIVRIQEPGYTIQNRPAIPARVWVQKVEPREIEAERGVHEIPQSHRD